MCLALCTLVCPLVWADGVNIGGIYYRLNGNTASVTYTYKTSEFPQVNTYTGDIIIPDSVTYQGKVYRVTGIIQYAFTNTSITSIVLPESMKTIAENTFTSTPQLTRIVWNGRATKIEKNTYYGKGFVAPSLREIVIGENVDSLPPSMLDKSPVKVVRFNARNCRYTDCVFGQDYNTSQTSTNIDSILIGDSVESIPSYFCHSVSNVKYIQLGKNVRSIGYLAFDINDSYLNHWPDTLRLPSTLEYVDENGFPPFKSVLYIPRSLKYCIAWNVLASDQQYHIEDLGAWARMYKGNFSNLQTNDLYFADTLITYLNLPDTLTSISPYSFYKARSIQGFHLPDSLRTIGDYALTDVKGPQTLIMPEHVNSIGKEAMLRCHISDIYLNQDAPFSIGTHAMYNVVSYISSKDQTPNIYMSCNGDLNAFQSHSEWKKYTLRPFSTPYKVRCDTAYFGDMKIALKGNVSYDCDLKMTLVDASSPYSAWYFSHWSDGVTDSIRYFTSDTTIMAHYERDTDYEPDSILYTATQKLPHVSGNALGFHPRYIHVLPMEHTFADSKGVIRFSDPVTDIGDSTFYGCNKMTGITLSASVERIGIYAFSLCNNLDSITCKAVTPPVCASQCFQYVNTSIPLYVPLQSVSAYQTADVWTNFNVQSIQDDTPTGVTNDISTVHIRKTIQKDQLIIEIGDIRYNILGSQIK